jgi:hypothetical protein
VNHLQKQRKGRRVGWATVEGQGDDDEGNNTNTEDLSPILQNGRHHMPASAPAHQQACRPSRTLPMPHTAGTVTSPPYAAVATSLPMRSTGCLGCVTLGGGAGAVGAWSIASCASGSADSVDPF